MEIKIYSDENASVPFLPLANEVWGKLKFIQVSVIHSVYRGGGVMRSLHVTNRPWTAHQPESTPPLDSTPLWKAPFVVTNPTLDNTSTWTAHPLGPSGQHITQTANLLDSTPLRQYTPRTATPSPYGQQAGGTHPTGMLSCSHLRF